MIDSPVPEPLPQPKALFSMAQLRKVTAKALWDILLITAGCVIFSFGINSIIVYQGLISGGVFGFGLLIYYDSHFLTPAIWYLIFNIPIFFLGWRTLSLRFIAFSLYGVLITFLATSYIHWQAPIHDPLLASVAAGVLCGVGFGIMLWSRGSDGGTTIIGIIMHVKWNLRVGQVSMGFNIILFAICLFTMDVEKVLYSMIFVFAYTTVADNMGAMFNQRKMVLIISERPEEIAREILTRLRRGVTLLEGRGAFTGRKREVILTVVHNYQTKRLEDLVYSLDSNAFVIIENTFNVLGTGFSKRKTY